MTWIMLALFALALWERLSDVRPYYPKEIVRNCAHCLKTVKLRREVQGEWILYVCPDCGYSYQIKAGKDREREE